MGCTSLELGKIIEELYVEALFKGVVDMYGFAKYVGDCSIYVAELCYWRLGYRAVELNIDSVTVVHGIRHGWVGSCMGHALVKKIREAKQCANALVN